MLRRRGDIFIENKGLIPAGLRSHFGVEKNVIEGNLCNACEAILQQVER